MSPMLYYQLQVIYQLRDVFQHHHLYQRLKQILCIPLFGCSESQSLFIQEFERLIKQKTQFSPLQLAEIQNKIEQDGSGVHPLFLQCVRSKCITDSEMYDQLHKFFHQVIRTHPECKEKELTGMDHTENNSGRSESRVSFILDLLGWKTETKQAESFTVLDIGCGNGEILANLADALQFSPAQALACDIRHEISSSAAKKITYHQLDISETKLPYPNESCDLVVTLMSLHHIPHYRSTLSEISRILKPEGKLILREHDLFTPYLSLILDVVHALYDCVFVDPPLQSGTQFCESYIAYYQSRVDWRSAIKSCQLQPMSHSPDQDGHYRFPIPIYKLQPGRKIKNVLASYVGIYEKNNLFCVKRQKLE